MHNGFWEEEYIKNPNFEELYNYVDENPENVLILSHKYEIECKDDLFYQAIQLDPIKKKNYIECENALCDMVVGLLNKTEVTIFIEENNIFYSKIAESLTGLDASKLTKMKNLCGRAKKNISAREVRDIIKCSTRGLAIVCMLLVEWEMLFLIQDVHGCILFPNKCKQKGYLEEVCQKNKMVLSSIKSEDNVFE